MMRIWCRCGCLGRHSFSITEDAESEPADKEGGREVELVNEAHDLDALLWADVQEDEPVDPLQ